MESGRRRRSPEGTGRRRVQRHQRCCIRTIRSANRPAGRPRSALPPVAGSNAEAPGCALAIHCRSDIHPGRHARCSRPGRESPSDCSSRPQGIGTEGGVGRTFRIRQRHPTGLCPTGGQGIPPGDPASQTVWTCRAADTRWSPSRNIRRPRTGTTTAWQTRPNTSCRAAHAGRRGLCASALVARRWLARRLVQTRR
jgi:hypothetical protein